jgi:hypothetical protein
MSQSRCSAALVTLGFSTNGGAQSVVHKLPPAMPDSAQMVQIQGTIIAVIALAILIVVPILVIRFRRKYVDVRPNVMSGAPTSGTVQFTFHKYSGFLIFVRQRRFDLVLPISEAEVLLKRLVRHNLTWGLLVYGGPIVPIFTYFEWCSQKKRIAAAQHGFPGSIK